MQPYTAVALFHKQHKDVGPGTPYPDQRKEQKPSVLQRNKHPNGIDANALQYHSQPLS